MITKTVYCVDDLRCISYNKCKGKCGELNNKEKEEETQNEY